jgi:hypothetical protein
MPQAYSMPPQRKASAAAVASLIFGILGCVPLVTGLLAIVCGMIGLRTTRDPLFSGRGMAVAGLVLGLVSFLAWGFVALTSGTAAYFALTYTREARTAANAVARELAAGDVEAAKARSADRVTREELAAVAAALKPFGALRDTTMPVGSRQNVNGVDEAYVAGFATFDKAGRVPYAVMFRREGGTLKVVGLAFTPTDGQPIAAGTKPEPPDPEQTGKTMDKLFD